VYSGQSIVLITHPPSTAKVKERVQLYLYSPSLPVWPVLGWTLPLLLTGKDKKCRFRICVVICYKVWKETEDCNKICSHKWNIHFNSTGHEIWFSSSFLWLHFQFNVFDITHITCNHLVVLTYIQDYSPY